MKLVTLLLPEAYLEGLDKLVGQQERETGKEGVVATRKGRVRRPPRPSR